jgi:hypothetical protein
MGVKVYKTEDVEAPYLHPTYAAPSISARQRRKAHVTTFGRFGNTGRVWKAI